MAFGKKGGGGRRFAPRQPIGLAAQMFSIECTAVAILVDVSNTGAKLRGSKLPTKGSEVWIRVGCVDVLSTVIWSRGDECGVTFDTPLRPYEIHHLRTEGSCAMVTKLTPEERLVVQDWTIGLAR